MKNRIKTIIILVLVSGMLTLIASFLFYNNTDNGIEYISKVAIWSVWGAIRPFSMKRYLYYYNTKNMLRDLFVYCFILGVLISIVNIYDNTIMQLINLNLSAIIPFVCMSILSYNLIIPSHTND